MLYVVQGKCGSESIEEDQLHLTISKEIWVRSFHRGRNRIGSEEDAIPYIVTVSSLNPDAIPMVLPGPMTS